MLGPQGFASGLWAKVSLKGYGPTQSPNARGFALQWNTGYNVYSAFDKFNPYDFCNNHKKYHT